MQNLEQRVQRLEDRNRRVEAEKAWETSWTRRVFLTLLTYLAIGLYLRAIGIGRPWLNAVVPAAAFIISTFTMAFFRKLWLKHRVSR